MTPDVLLEKISNIQSSIISIEKHVTVLNDEQGELVIQMTAIATKMEMAEKLLWAIILASVAAIVGAAWSLILHRRNHKGGDSDG